MNKDLVLLMDENLTQVWNERDPARRSKTIERIYTSDCYLYHVGHQSKGYEALNESVNNVLTKIPTAFSFFKLKPVIINNNVGRLIWGMGDSMESIVATGMDIAVFEGGKIKSLYVFLD